MFVKTKLSELSDFCFGDFCVILQLFVRYNEQHVERDIHSNPSVHLLGKIAVALDVSLKQLVGPDTPEPKPDPAVVQEWYDLFQDAVKYGISRKELKSIIEFRKWQVGHSEKEEE
ncbi:hypothetical protein [Paenibacillus sedimenti]|uniref:HTH cro/C1-type domain-containing protein n=1 Tax=Paenibacillus sedimenti TaxID=2770274 RepID=A0A926KVC6_9BACL|nr:hypothetical protein [Paenibacillus sedimenti]MBD0384217.1 hypothetical protein [Paenibacillus sedimenti]